MSPGFFSVWYDRRQGKFVNLCHIVIPKWKTVNLKSRSILTKYSNRLTDWCIVKSLVLRKKVAYFEEIGTFWWFFTKCHTFCNILLKIGSKPYCMVLCTKSGLFRGDRHVLVVLTKCHTLCNILLTIGSKP